MPARDSLISDLEKLEQEMQTQANACSDEVVRYDNVLGGQATAMALRAEANTHYRWSIALRAIINKWEHREAKTETKGITVCRICSADSHTDICRDCRANDVH